MALPEWIPKFVIITLMVGFPIALVLAWAFEITPEGIKKESDIAPEDSISAHTGRKLDFIIIGLLVAVAGYFIYESRFESQTDESVAIEDMANQGEPLKKVDQEPKGSSIAVLPFVNMSSDKEQEYFSDGISEEILNVLSKIPNLHVTSRSSAFAFKDTKINISEVANKLGVKNVLEGSVRKSGNRVRITAQLIEADSDKHLWSETYDRELTDIFAIQDEISAAIVLALKSKLGLDVEAEIRDKQDVNLQAHNEYLIGRFYVEKRTEQDLELAIKHFDNAIELDPEYAPAWMGKGWAVAFYRVYSNNFSKHPFEGSYSALDKALELDPDLPETHALIGYVNTRRKPDLAISHFKKAINLNPNYADAYTWYAMALSGQPQKQFKLTEKALQLNPMSLNANATHGDSHISFGQLDEAEKIAERMLSIDNSTFLAFRLLSNIYQHRNEYGKAAYYATKAVKVNPAFIFQRWLAADLAQIAMPEKAAEIMANSPVPVWQHYYNNNHELFVSQSRAQYPGSEDNVLGNFMRGIAEFINGNYPDAVRYLEKSFCRNCNPLIYSLNQVGDTESATAMINRKRSKILKRINSGEKYLEDELMELAYIEGNVEQAVKYLKSSMKNGYMMAHTFIHGPISKKLRQHPEWPAILAESDRQAAEQREIYLTLIAEDEKGTLLPKTP